MAEEITREIVKEIVTETMSASSQPSDSSWIPTMGIIVSILVLAFSIYQFNQTQKQHNKAQEKAQTQFNETQEKAKNLEFMKQLEYYSVELSDVRKEFTHSPQKYDDCIVFCKNTLIILNRISYLKIKGLVNRDFIQFFESSFDTGRTCFNWLKFTNRRPTSFDNNYLYFNEIKKDIEYSPNRTALRSPFYYYANRFNGNSSYDPNNDPTDPKTYVVIREDFALIRPTD